MGKYISLQAVIEKAMVFPSVREMQMSDLTSWTIDILRGLKFPLLYIDDNAVREVKNSKAELPCDIQYIKQIDAILKANKTQFGNIEEYSNTINSALQNPLPVITTNVTYRKTMRYNTSSFNRTDINIQDNNIYNNDTHEFTYSINGDTLYAGFDSGVIEIAYRKLAIDNETGLPLILDNNELIRAITDYLIASSNRVLYYSGKITNDIYQDSMQKYYFAIASAHGSLHNEHLLNTDVQEMFGNVLQQYVLNAYTHYRDYNDLGSKQKLIVK